MIAAEIDWGGPPILLHGMKAIENSDMVFPLMMDATPGNISMEINRYMTEKGFSPNRIFMTEKQRNDYMKSVNAFGWAKEKHGL